jgi:Domain of unknown function (DUF4124)
MKRIFFIISILLLLLSNLQASAEIYKTVDADGRVTYSNVRSKGAKKLDLGIAETPVTPEERPNAKRSETTKTVNLGGYPKVDSNTQSQRDGKRRDILKAELDQEKQALEKAKQDYEDAKNTPEVYKGANGKTFRNVVKYEEKLKAIEEQISAHERNIALLNKELNL